MSMIKRIWIKLTAALLTAGAVLGYSVWKNHFAEKDPDLREMKRFLKSASAADAEKLSLKYSRVENRFFRKKKFAEVRRLNQLMREYGGKVSFPNYFYDFSDYTSYVGEGDYSRALETLKRIETMPGQSPEIRGAILGEQIRCIAERDGIDAASREFKSRIAEAAQPMFRPAYTAYINTLYRHRRPDEALQATLEAGERILPEAGTPPFVARLGGDLLRNGKDERRLAELIPPEKRPADFCAALFDMADACIRQGELRKAEQLLRSAAENKSLPENLSQFARMKLKLCLEKKKGSKQ